MFPFLLVVTWSGLTIVSVKRTFNNLLGRIILSILLTLFFFSLKSFSSSKSLDN